MGRRVLIRGRWLGGILAGATVVAAAVASAADPAPPPNAAKAAPSYLGVEKAIAELKAGWKSPETTPEQAPGWNTFFDALQRGLAAYGAAPNTDARLTALNQVYQLNLAMAGAGWDQTAKVQAAVTAWLEPRTRLAWAERRLLDAMGLATPTAEEAANAKAWGNFLNADLGAALRAYESAQTVQARHKAMGDLQSALSSLQKSNQAQPWAVSQELEAAVVGLHNHPNLDISADVATLSPIFAKEVVQTGPVYRGGYVSQVVAGPYAGFGLLPSAEGIAFYNRQYASASTPITDFQNQVASDRRGRVAAKLYQFSAASYDNPLTTVTAVLTPNGLFIYPDAQHAISASFGAAPQPGKGLQRAVLSVIGLNKRRITNQVAKGAMPKIQEGVITNGTAEAQERSAEAQAEENAKLQKFLVGDNTLSVQDFLVKNLAMQSQPTNAIISGTLLSKANPGQLGADAPQPGDLYVPDAGLSVDVHLGSVLTNVVAGLLAGPKVVGVDNIVITTKPIPPGGTPKDAVNVQTNVAFADYLKAVDASRATQGMQVIRIKKPTKAPVFAADRTGKLVSVIYDLMIEVPAPPSAAKGGLAGPRAKVYRITAPAVEILSNIAVEAPAADQPPALKANIADFVHGTDARVQAIWDNEANPTTLDPFRGNLVLGVIRGELQKKPLNVPLNSVPLKGFVLKNVSPLDPSGWIRVVLSPTGESPIAPPAPAAPAPAQSAEVAPAPAPAPAEAASLPPAEAAAVSASR